MSRCEKGDGVPRVYHKLRNDDRLSTHRESRDNNHTLRETPESRTSNHKRDDEPPRSIDFNLSSSVNCPIALPVTAEATDKELTGDRVLRDTNNSNIRGSRGIDMVGKKFKFKRRETNINSNARFDNSIRCSKNGGRGEWKLNPRLFREICRRLGQHSVDLFASRLTKQMDPYIS